MNTNTVLITGACINTGVAIVEKFAREGYDAIFTGRNSEHVERKEREYRASFPDRMTRGIPLTSLKEDGAVDEEGVKKLFEALDRESEFFRQLFRYRNIALSVELVAPKLRLAKGDRVCSCGKLLKAFCRERL